LKSNNLKRNLYLDIYTLGEVKHFSNSKKNQTRYC